MTPTFNFTKISDYGTENYIVARLSLQIFQILEHCKIDEAKSDSIKSIYVDQLMPQLIHCWEIEEKYRRAFNQQVQSYEDSMKSGKRGLLPFIPPLEQECHNFLYEYKNFVRNLLGVFNILYGTAFIGAGQFYPKNIKQDSVIKYAESEFGISDPKTIFLKDAETNIRSYLAMRDAVEHPGGGCGTLRVSNFVQGSDLIVDEPCWWREENGNEIDKNSIRLGFEIGIHDLLTLAEDILISWANEHLLIPGRMHIIHIPKEQRKKTVQ